MNKRFVVWMLCVVLLIGLLPVSAAALEMNANSEAVLMEDSNEVFVGLSPDEIFPFIHDNSYRPYLPESLDLSGCTLGRLYIYNEETQQLSQITTVETGRYVCGTNCIYYFTDGNVLMQTDFAGRAHTRILEAPGEQITSLKIRNNMMYFIMDKYSLITYNLLTGYMETVCQHEGMFSAYMFAEGMIKCSVWPEEYIIVDIRSEEQLRVSTQAETYAIMDSISPSNIESAKMIPLFSLENNVSFPLDEYPATAMDANGDFSLSDGAEVYFNDTNKYVASCNHGTGVKDCKSYRECKQCYGFAVYAHDCFWHLVDLSEDASLDWASGDRVNTDVSLKTVTAVKSFFEGLSRGAYIRYSNENATNYQEGIHSVALDYVTTDGFWAYECNVDNKCGIFYRFFTFEEIQDHYSIVTQYVNHDPAIYEYVSSTTHNLKCSNCAGYVVQNHDAYTYTIYSTTQHLKDLPCCTGHSVIENHVRKNGVCIQCGYVEGSVSLGIKQTGANGQMIQLSS